MQEQKTLRTFGDTVDGRYMIEDILGEGGFSTVYLVRDLQTTVQDAQDQRNLFALKELHNQSRQEQIRFEFEGSILDKLDHPALPHFYRIFQAQEHSQQFILLEYIAGPNLEVLRRQQPDKRFSVAEVLTIMQPVINAVTYLHNQQPPVIHRDIKPANIIVPGSGKQAVLVDFGIAKEYEADDTTTAIRHCSPGYGAPEQYSGYGTDTRTDIYGLGATCYTLLTGITPSDAFHRTTTLVSRKRDSLVSMTDTVPSIPTHVVRAVERAMSIGQEGRFSTAQEFWHALCAPPDLRSSQLPTTDPSRSSTTPKKAVNQEIYQSIPRHIHDLRGPKGRLLVSLCVAFFIILGAGLGFYSFTRNNHTTASASSSSAASQLVSHVTPTTESNYYLRIKRSYTGTIHDLLTDKSTAMSLTQISQTNERINGSFTGSDTAGTFTGVLDTSRHIFFTMKGDSAHSPIFFEGAVRADGNLIGNYCDVDKNGQCTGNYGLWSVAPSLQ
ncbi:MAG: hypothetical protein PVSMB5_29810 [Ktedonobacteraceae bacterium]